MIRMPIQRIMRAISPHDNISHDQALPIDAKPVFGKTLVGIHCMDFLSDLKPANYVLARLWNLTANNKYPISYRYGLADVWHAGPKHRGIPEGWVGKTRSQRRVDACSGDINVTLHSTPMRALATAELPQLRPACGTSASASILELFVGQGRSRSPSLTSRSRKRRRHDDEPGLLFRNPQGPACIVTRLSMTKSLSAAHALRSPERPSRRSSDTGAAHPLTGDGAATHRR